MSGRSSKGTPSPKKKSRRYRRASSTSDSKAASNVKGTESSKATSSGATISTKEDKSTQSSAVSEGATSAESTSSSAVKPNITSLTTLESNPNVQAKVSPGAPRARPKTPPIVPFDYLDPTVDPSKFLPQGTAHNLQDIKSRLERNVSAERYKEILSNFKGDKSTADMFQYIWDLREAHQYLVPSLVISMKCSRDSEKFRNEGNVYYKSKNFDKALELYNMSILAAPHPSVPATFIPRLQKMLEAIAKAKKDKGENDFEVGEDGEGRYKNLALGYANRSAVLCAQQNYEKCLSDINFAIMYGLPERIRVKLEIRQAKCMEALSITKPGAVSSPPETRLTFDDITEMFVQCKISNEAPVIPEILLSPSKKAKDMAAAVDPQQSQKAPKLVNPNPSIPSLSTAISLVYNPIKGRCLVAQRAIRPGEVIAIDTSYVSTLYLGNLTNHCSNCFSKCHTVQPCPNCAKVAFCSIECWIKGLTGEHSRECSTLPTLVALQRGIREHLLPSLGYKMLLNNGYLYFRKKLPELLLETQVPNQLRGFNAEGIYDSTDFRTVYHLVTNKEKFSQVDLYSKCATAFILIKILFKSERFFVDEKGEELQPTREELFYTGGTLFHFLMSLACNAYELSKWELTSNPSRVVARPIGGSVFPTLALMNHSCSPTTRHYFDGKRMILRANTFIPAGGEITDDYCGNFYEKGFAQRREVLKEYFFDCMCEACTGKWDVYNKLSASIQVRCSVCSNGVTLAQAKPQCTSCRLDMTKNGRAQTTWWRQVKHMKYAKDRYDYVVLKLDLSHPVAQEDLSAVCNYLEVLKKCAAFPMQEYCFAQETLYKLFCHGL